MNEKLEKALAAVKEIFGESTDPETIKKFKVVEDQFNEADQEMNNLTDRYGKLAKEYRDIVLHTDVGKKEDDVLPPKPMTFDEALAEAFKTAETNAKKENK